MPNEHRDIESKLNVAPHLTADERVRLWQGISSRISTSAPIVSPYHFISLYSKPMIPLLIALVVLLGAGGTVAASDNARPGDVLFPVDRAIEDVRFALAPSTEKESLKVKFTNERLREFESVTHEALNDDVAGQTLTEAEADIFTNETLVKIEAGDRKAVFSTEASTREGIVKAIVDEYGFASADVEALLVIETEDRASRLDDGAQVSERNRARMQNALDVLSGFLLGVNGQASSTPEVSNALRIIEERLRDRSASLPGDFRMKIRGDEGRIELRGEDGRVRVEVRNGEVRVKTEDKDDDQDDDRGRGRDDERTASSTPAQDDSDDESNSSDDDSDTDEDEGDDDRSGSDDDSDEDEDEDENDDDNSGSGSSGSGS